MKTGQKIGMVAPSSRVPQIELKIGLESLREAGFQPVVHPQVRKHHLFWAGTDEERARAFFAFAHDSRFAVLWSCRGGYGAARLLPLLKKLTTERGAPPRKLLVGYSDTTALMDYVRTKWGWSTLHAPMPGMRKFSIQTEDEWRSLVSFVRKGSASEPPWEATQLAFYGRAPRAAIRAPLVGGNLSLVSSLLGTPDAADFRGKMLFLEDVDEPLYRLDRMFRQFIQAGGLKGVKALLLGNFLACQDSVGQVLAHAPKPANYRRMLTTPRPRELKLLRPKLETQRALNEIFGEPCRELGIPVAFGLPVGHGPEIAALPLGQDTRYSLSPKGKLELLSWSWR
ncbi:MAG: LD-carboxypeptidase [Oligoflexia bacterium]|nr:LD-carboxypeptidase [Oligoflexia bacterium]